MSFRKRLDHLLLEVGDRRAADLIDHPWPASVTFRSRGWRGSAGPLRATAVSSVASWIERISRPYGRSLNLGIFDNAP